MFWKSIKRQKPKRSKACTEILYEDELYNNPQSVCYAFANYFHELYSPSDGNNFDTETYDIIKTKYEEYKSTCTSENHGIARSPGGLITEEDIVLVIKLLKRRKACGQDHIQNEHII